MKELLAFNYWCNKGGKIFPRSAQAVLHRFGISKKTIMARCGNRGQGSCSSTPCAGPSCSAPCGGGDTNGRVIN